MNTGFLGHAVATVLTVYGIETRNAASFPTVGNTISLQQYLPFTVLKRLLISLSVVLQPFQVATVLTVYGIETLRLQAL